MKSKKILALLVIIVIAVLGYAIFRKLNPAVKIPEGQLSEKQIKTLVTKVSKLINVPEETPVIITIKKAEQLIASQKFYVGSKDGDYLMVFPKTQKAIIYRKSEGRLINVGPIIIDQPATTTKPVVNEIQSVSTSSKATPDIKSAKDKE